MLMLYIFKISLRAQKSPTFFKLPCLSLLKIAPARLAEMMNITSKGYFIAVTYIYPNILYASEC